MNWQTFSHLAFAFRVTPPLLATGLGFALLMGLAGRRCPGAPRCAPADRRGTAELWGRLTLLRTQPFVRECVRDRSGAVEMGAQRRLKRAAAVGRSSCAIPQVCGIAYTPPVRLFPSGTLGRVNYLADAGECVRRLRAGDSRRIPERLGTCRVSFDPALLSGGHPSSPETSRPHPVDQVLQNGARFAPPCPSWRNAGARLERRPGRRRSGRISRVYLQRVSLRVCRRARSHRSTECFRGSDGSLQRLPGATRGLASIGRGSGEPRGKFRYSLGRLSTASGQIRSWDRY
jgi:hypothetical protein